MASCASSTDLLKRFFEERLSGVEMQDLKCHLLQCAECRKKAMGKEPLVIFSLLSLRRKEQSFWKGYWDRIASGISVKRILPWRFPLLQPSPVAAAFAAILIITVLSIMAVVRTGHVEQSVQQLPPAAQVIEKAALPLRSPVVDTTVQPTAKVVTLSVGDTDVVMIFDENMDI